MVVTASRVNNLTINVPMPITYIVREMAKIVLDNDNAIMAFQITNGVLFSLFLNIAVPLSAFLIYRKINSAITAVLCRLMGSKSQ